MSVHRGALGDLSNYKVVLKSIQDSVQSLQSAMKRPELFTYEWLDLSPIISTVWLVACYYYRTVGSLEKSEGYNTKGITTVEKYLKELNNIGFMLDKKRNDNALFSLFVKFNLLQDMIVIHLSRMEFVLATKNSLKLIEYLYQFPDLFVTYRHNIHLLLGILFFMTEKDRKDSSANKHFEFVINNCPSKQLVAWAMIFQMFWKLNASQSTYSTKDMFREVDDFSKYLKKNGLREAENFHSIISFIKGILCYRNNALQEAKSHFSKCIESAEETNSLPKNVVRQCMLSILKSLWKKDESNKQAAIEEVTKILAEANKDQDLIGKMQALSTLLYLANYSSNNNNTDSMLMDTTPDVFDAKNIHLSQPEPISGELDQTEHRFQENIQTLFSSGEISSQYSTLLSWFPDTNDSYQVMLNNI